MPNLTASAVRTLRPQAITPNQRAANALGPVPVPSPAPPQEVPSKTLDLDIIGPRKLVRPTLPDGMRRDRSFQRRDETALIARSPSVHSAGHESAHAESFYLQKQVQAQTPMVIVLDDGEKIEGSIEWYDHNVIKVRAGSSSPFRNGRLGESATRVLIYKSSIKYLFKAGENSTL
jgi:hypothetical protein